jgi:predicted hydrocarbon binding protein
MSERQDFEQMWLAKFTRCLDEVVGEDIRKQVMAGSEALASNSSTPAIAQWTREAMERLEALAGEESSRRVMLGCACQYPKPDLQEIRHTFQATGDLDLAHRLLQERFETFLRDTLRLSDELVADIVRRGWGVAGVRDGNTIIATKIPKSGTLVEYVHETDPEKRRQYYCHCPRVREVLKGAETIPVIYCYCGAGFYKGIWEEILQEPVKVEVLESVLRGDDVCTFAIYLP